MALSLTYFFKLPEYASFQDIAYFAGIAHYKAFLGPEVKMNILHDHLAWDVETFPLLNDLAHKVLSVMSSLSQINPETGKKMSMGLMHKTYTSLKM